MLCVIALLNLLTIITFSEDYALCHQIKGDGLCKSCGKDCFRHNFDQYKFTEIHREKDVDNDIVNE